nr:hypothetical protein [Lachnospiraceae bacterium]
MSKPSLGEVSFMITLVMICSLLLGALTPSPVEAVPQVEGNRSTQVVNEISTDEIITQGNTVVYQNPTTGYVAVIWDE